MATNVEIFRASLARSLKSPSFLREFYNYFMDSSPEVAEKFRNTDFPRQTRILADSLHMMAVAAESTSEEGVVFQELRRLARIHSRSKIDIRPELYDSWLDCLIKAVKKLDPDFSPEIETAWRETLAKGIEYLRSRY